MKTALSLLLAWVILGAPAFADAITDQVASWPWNEHAVVIVQPETEASLLVSIEYAKKGVVSDTDQYGVKPLTDRTSFEAWAKGKCRCGPNGGCSGVARIENISAEGFTAAFNLAWTSQGKRTGEFKESFNCKWVSTQIFQRDGFDVAVRVSSKKARN
jgi:hypothetical protein